jgi:hypothetical protein
MVINIWGIIIVFILLSVNFFCNISSYDILAYITKNYIALIYYAKKENVRDTRNASLASDRYNVVVDVVFKCLRQRSNGLKICVCQQYFTCVTMCFLGFIRYNKIFIACGFKKYENLFTHEYHIPLGKYDTLGWINFHISLHWNVVSDI